MTSRCLETFTCGNAGSPGTVSGTGAGAGSGSVIFGVEASSSFG